MLIDLLMALIVFFQGEAHTIYVHQTLPDRTELVDQVFGQPLPFVIADLDGIDSNPSAAADAETLAVVWEISYPNQPMRLQYAYTQNGRIWRNAPVPPTNFKYGVHSPRLTNVGGDVFALRFRVNGDCREHLAYLDMRYGEPRWSLPIIGSCSLNLPMTLQEGAPPKPKP